MTSRKKRVVTILSLVVVLLTMAGLGVYRAWHHVPTFYEQALSVDETRQSEAAQEMGARVTTLYNDCRKVGRWQALFTAEQINGWLAVDLAELHPGLLPSELQNPRVQITPEAMTIAANLRSPKLNAIVSIVIEPFVYEQNAVGLRLRSVRAGALPLPMNDVLSRISKAGESLDPPLQWTQIDGDPVAIFTLSPEYDSQDRELLLDKIELRDGELFVAGTTGNPPSALQARNESDTQR